MKKDENLEKLISELTEEEAKAALEQAVMKMEAALKCRECPIFQKCFRGAIECRERILAELLGREYEGVRE